MSPVFDVANRFLVVDIKGGAVTRRSEHNLGDDGRVEKLSGLGVDVLICSAISWPVEAMLWVAGIEVVSDICGPTDEIVDAYRTGERDLARVHSPGYSVRKRGGRTFLTGTARGTEDRTPQHRNEVVAKL